MTRALVAVAVAALVVLAGCGASPAAQTMNPGADSPGDDETKNDDSLSRVTVPSGLVAPGASQRGIPNPRILLQSHFQSLSQSSYRVTLSYPEIGSGGDTDVRYSLTRGQNGWANETHKSRNGSETTKRVYRTGDVAIAQFLAENGSGSEYAMGPTKPVLEKYQTPSQRGPSVMLLYFQLSTKMKPTGFATRNGEKVVRYENAGVNETRVEQFGSILGVPNGTLQDMEFTVFVDANGVVHESHAEIVVETDDGETRSTNFDYQISDLNETTVDEPSWTDGVPQVNGSVEADGKLVVLENVGEARIQNYSIGVAGNVSAQTAVNRTFAPGETAYVYATGDGNDTTLHVSTERPDLPSDARTLTERTSVRAYLGTPNVSISLGLFLNENNESDRIAAARIAPGEIGHPATQSTPIVSAASTERLQHGAPFANEHYLEIGLLNDA